MLFRSGIVTAVGQTFREEELIATDIPWAVAWYADRSAVLLPEDQKSFLRINDDVHGIAGIYMTQETHLNLRLVDVVVPGSSSFWLYLFTTVNSGLGMQVMDPLLPGGGQMLQSSRPRWLAGEEKPLTAP